MSEFFAVLVRDPAGLVTALAGDIGKHSVPALTGFWITRSGTSAAVADETELALGDEHVTRWSLWQESAMRAWLTGEAKRAALAYIVAGVPKDRLGSRYLSQAMRPTMSVASAART